MCNANWYQFWSKIDPLLTFEKRSILKRENLVMKRSHRHRGCNTGETLLGTNISHPNGKRNIIIFKSAFERGYLPRGLTIVSPSHALEQVGTYLEQLTHMAHDSEARLGRTTWSVRDVKPPRKEVLPECWNARQHGNYPRYTKKQKYIWK